MNSSTRTIALFTAMAAALVAVGVFQSWPLALAILNLCLISAIMSLGVNIQWGYAGLFNVGVMGFTALGGLAGVLISVPPVTEALQAGGFGIFIALVLISLTIAGAILIYKRLPAGKARNFSMIGVIVIGYFLTRYFFFPAVDAIEAVDSARTGYLGGLGLPIIFSWVVGGVFAAAVAWVVGKIALGLRSDYLAIATLGISEIIIAVLKNEDWMTRGVKNVSGLPRPVPYEIDLQQTLWFQDWASYLGMSPVDFSSVFVKLCYAGLFTVVLLILLWFSERALHSPWGRMMRAIRDNELSSAAMGKNIKGRHLQVFVLGSAVIGIAGAMLTTLDGQFTPASYQPLRFTFIVWVMVIVGGSGNNLGAILGGFLIWFVWVEAEPFGLWLMDVLSSGMAEDSDLRKHLLNSAAHMRLMTMGLILLLVLRFSPRGLIPEK
ncbi:branched-chain amino acid ABC transporter permease [Alphaproteobacteria bacterium 46_93_T64]|nr:branched-chain amino acid ABC transporter permease [Alphaproteobacteria bacterium 46_93_T64]